QKNAMRAWGLGPGEGSGPARARLGPGRANGAIKRERLGPWSALVSLSFTALLARAGMRWVLRSSGVHSLPDPCLRRGAAGGSAGAQEPGPRSRGPGQVPGGATPRPEQTPWELPGPYRASRAQPPSPAGPLEKLRARPARPARPAAPLAGPHG